MSRKKNTVNWFHHRIPNHSARTRFSHSSSNDCSLAYLHLERFFHFRCLSNKLERIPKKLANLGLWFFSWMKNLTSFLCCFINSNVTTKSNDPKMKRMEMKQFPTNWTIYHWKFKLHYVNSREYRIEIIFSLKSTKTVDWARIILAEIMFLG